MLEHYSHAKASIRRSRRRRFLAQSIAGVGAASLSGIGADTLLASAENADDYEQRARSYLKTLLLSREDVDGWLKQKVFPFCKYDSELGYLHINRDFKEGQDGAICQYRYDKLDARRMMAYGDQPCRINTYGNSFTSCEQVSDGETWQEVLAAHLGEPVRNYGIGGYSVYQAYLRMLREEKRAAAKYIIFNIFDDDHYRHLGGWYRFKFGVNRISPNPTVPYLVVDPDEGKIVKRLNPCPTAESVYQLCDLDRVYELFKHDLMLKNRLGRIARKQRGEEVPPSDYDDAELTRYGIYATTQVVDKVEQFAKRTNKTVLYVLSYGGYVVRQFMEHGGRFDQALVGFLNDRKLPYVDLLKAHDEDFDHFRADIDAYLSRYYIGHYNPLGNFFCADAIKEKLVAMMDPKPPAFSTSQFLK